MNERDSEALSCLLELHGHRRVYSESSADILLYNTCSVRDQAERKVIGKIGILKRLKRQRPDIKIGLIGCVGERLGSKLFDELPHLDFVMGTGCLSQAPMIFARLASGETHIVAGSADPFNEENVNTLHCSESALFSYVSVIHGCDQFCTYCIVPFTRGREKSREISAICDEIGNLTENGCREVLLLGQNITAYGLAEAKKAGTYTDEISPFADLLEALQELPKLQRIRFTSPHVRFMNAKFIETVCALPKVCKAFHIPLQSGSNRILELMNRGYTVEEYLEKIAAIKSLAPDAVFSTDVIVGFPGESEEEFTKTREIMQQVGYDMAYIFRYSERTGTKAARVYKDDVPEEVKQERNQILLNDLNERVEKANQKFIGKKVEVLVEGESKRNPKRWTGRSDLNKVCLFEKNDDELQVGDLRLMEVTRVSSNALYGVI